MIQASAFRFGTENSCHFSIFRSVIISASNVVSSANVHVKTDEESRQFTPRKLSIWANMRLQTLGLVPNASSDRINTRKKQHSQTADDKVLFRFGRIVEPILCWKCRDCSTPSSSQFLTCNFPISPSLLTHAHTNDSHYAIESISFHQARPHSICRCHLSKSNRTKMVLICCKKK